MPDNEHDVLAKRIKAAQEARGGTKKSSDKTDDYTAAGGAIALRMGTEFVASVLVGVLMGVGIDHFLGTSPWGFFVMLGFGLAAGVLSVIRAYRQINADLAAAAGESTDPD